MYVQHLWSPKILFKPENIVKVEKEAWPSEEHEVIFINAKSDIFELEDARSYIKFRALPSLVGYDPKQRMKGNQDIAELTSVSVFPVAASIASMWNVKQKMKRMEDIVSAVGDAYERMIDVAPNQDIFNIAVIVKYWSMDK